MIKAISKEKLVSPRLNNKLVKGKDKNIKLDLNSNNLRNTNTGYVKSMV